MMGVQCFHPLGNAGLGKVIPHDKLELIDDECFPWFRREFLSAASCHVLPHLNIHGRAAGAMRGSVPVVPAPDSPRADAARPIGRPADVEGQHLSPGNPGTGKHGADSLKSLQTNKSSVRSVRLGGLELSIEESGDESLGHLLRKLCAMKVTWVLVTAIVIVLCAALTGPVLCKDSVGCTEDHLRDQDLRLYSALISSALAAVLLQEAASVVLTHQAARRAVDLIPDVKESLIPSCLLCATFIVLIVENLALVIGDVPWFAHAASLDREDLTAQPVYTVFYAEWLINVPILLVLAGSISLGRPPSEIGEPLLITNVYIVLAWMAHFIPNAPLRHLLGRPLLSFVLILVFGIYGLVYVGRLHGVISYRGERIFYTTMNFTTKLFASMTVAGIRSSEFQEALNCFGPLWLSRAAMPFLRKVDNAGIIMIGSAAGGRPMGSSIPYSMTRAAMNHLTKLLAKSQGPVRVNCVAPGLIETRITHGGEWDGPHAAVKAHTPLKRVGQPDDLGEAVLCCIRSRYMTGQTIYVDGGASLVF
eukprot:Skav214240  [mRNA]  locus=scaffold1133:195941:200937:- [translate_table: standard]